MKTSFRVLANILGAGLLLGTARFASADTLVTFQVDMSVQVQGGSFNPATDTVSARGSFNGWGTFVLTNNPSSANTNLYTGAFDDVNDSNGSQLDYKFYETVLKFKNVLVFVWL
ncbi:MAG: hypothetical protein KGR98_08420 [Verrucomicrobia bacterium]|nr:hypothetical protein [Verrucomicrobiota bacterium]